MTCKYKEQQTLKCFFVETAKAKHWPEAAASRNYRAAPVWQTQALLNWGMEGQSHRKQLGAGSEICMPHKARHHLTSETRFVRVF